MQRTDTTVVCAHRTFLKIVLDPAFETNIAENSHRTSPGFRLQRAVITVVVAAVAVALVSSMRPPFLLAATATPSIWPSPTPEGTRPGVKTVERLHVKRGLLVHASCRERAASSSHQRAILDLSPGVSFFLPPRVKSCDKNKNKNKNKAK